MDNGALYLALKVLESVCSEAEIVYQDDLTPTGDLVHLVVASASSIIKGTMEVAKKKEKMLGYVYKDMIEQSIKNMEKLVLVTSVLLTTLQFVDSIDFCDNLITQ